MEVLISLGLPLALAAIMVSLGIGLEVADFRRVSGRGPAFLLAVLAQILLLPALAFPLLYALSAPPDLAAGILLAALCPAGVAGPFLTRLAGGDVALAISLTVLTSLCAILTIPLLSVWLLPLLMGTAAPRISGSSIAISMFLLTSLPVALGVTIRQYFRGAALRLDPALSRLSILLAAIIIGTALIENAATLTGARPQTLLLLIGMPALPFALGWGMGRLLQLPAGQARALTLVLGTQNGALGVTLAGVIVGLTQGFSSLALPSALYGITMFAVALPYVWICRGRPA